MKLVETGLRISFFYGKPMFDMKEYLVGPNFEIPHHYWYDKVRFREIWIVCPIFLEPLNVCGVSGQAAQPVLFA